MNRNGLLATILFGIVVGLLFALYPELDLKLAALFYAGRDFAFAKDSTLILLRDLAMVIVGLLAAPAVIALVVKLARPQRPLLVRGRTIVYLISTLLIAPLLIANIILKDYWGRPRPREVAAFGGTQRFVAWWDPRGACPDNCSFIAGEAAGAFWTIAPASLAPPQWRPLAYAGALTFGAAVGILRMSFGGHFFSDVVFAGVITFLVIWLVHGLLYRWRATRTTDEAVENAIARTSLAVRNASARLFTRGGAARRTAQEKRP